jgi:zinc D-Ala-D-Ala carboxypeptidase
MSNISKHITMKEATFSSTGEAKGIDNSPTPEHLENMKLLAEKVFEPLREWYGKPIKINSFYRGKALNAAIAGSSSTSQHCFGQAMDIDTTSDNKKLFDYIKDNLDFDQAIAEFPTNGIPSWVHVSYKKTGNRKQVLVAKKVNGKATYIPYKSDKDLL